MAEEDGGNKIRDLPSLGGRPVRKGPPGGGPRGADGKFLPRKPRDEVKRPWVPEPRKPPQQHLVNDPSYEFPLVQIVDELVEKYGLSKRMARFLVIRPNFSTDKAACDATGMSARAMSQWRYNRDGPRFREAEDELYDRIKEAAQKKFNSMAFKVATRTDELLDAQKTVVTRVKSEDGTEDVVSYEPDHDARFKGIQAVSRWLGEWGTESKLVQNTQYVAVMDQFGKLMGKIVGEKVVEGQFREKEEEDG